MKAALPPVSSARAPAPPPGSLWQLATPAPGAPILSNPLLLTDGSVIFHQSCTGTWWKLTPDATGGYVNGSWSQIASLPAGYTPRFFSSAVLPDGRVITEGGEYNASCAPAWTNLGAIYDPLTDSWTAVAAPAGMLNIGDAESTVLANGTYMQSDSYQYPPALSALFNPSTLTWTSTGTGKADDYDEEGWTLLPNGNVLTVDAYVASGTCGRNSEVYSPTTGGWTSAGNTVSQLPDCSNPASNPSYEMGPQVLRPDGTVIAFGGLTCSDGPNSSCASGTLSVTDPIGIFNSISSTWAAGPNVPAVSGQNYTLADAPASLEPSGTVLFAASPAYQAFVTPTHFFEFSTGNTIAQVADTTDAGSFTAFQWNFLDLPTGQVVAVETDGSNVWIYTPTGGPNGSWAPTISSTSSNVVLDGTFKISGVQLNGLSQGAAYGDDQQAATNYPIVRITNGATGHVFYGRTFNHSTMTVGTGASASTNVTLPANIETGPSSLVVLANGIASNAVSVNVEHSAYAKQLDFNADKKSDILWRCVNTGASCTTGTLAIWEMNGGTLSAAVGGETITNGWQIVGTGDFNGDGSTDLLWRCTGEPANCTAGTIAIWEMSGGSVIASLGGQVVPDGWTVIGTGDFNGDGSADILWRCTDTSGAECINGTVSIWEMSGGTLLAAVGGQVVPGGWTVAGLGDFNGDGKADILWRCTDATGASCVNGTVAIWEMNGGTILAAVGGQVVPAGWTVAGTGDFNGDGKSDILWRCTDASNTTCTNGSVVIWEMNGGTVLASVGGQVVTANWQIAGVGDFNGDSLSDILWHCNDASNATCTFGSIAIWEMNGGTILASVGGQVVGPQWALVQ